MTTMDAYVDNLATGYPVPRDEPSDKPFIIWTLQRTGSTNLLRMLMYLSSWRTAEAEGFDPASPERQFSWIPGLAIEEQRDDAIRAVCAGRWNVKHVVDRLPSDFNRELALATTEAGYAHVVLDRRDRAARLSSLGVAERLGTWDANAKTERVLRDLAAGRIELDLDAQALLERQLAAERALGEVVRYLPSYHFVWFEDLYAGTLTERMWTFEALARHIGVSWIHDARRIERLLLNGGQDTSAALNGSPWKSELLRKLGDAP